MHAGAKPTGSSVLRCAVLAWPGLQITVLFADVVGFTPMCRELPPEVVMAFLNDLFSRLDELTAIYGVYKVETIGGAYSLGRAGLIDMDMDRYSRCYTACMCRMQC